MTKRKYTPTANLKDYISESLMILMQKKGFGDISIGEITEKAGVNRSSYYRNFNSKDDIVKYIYSKIIFGHIEKIKDKYEITLKNYLEIMFSHFYQYKNKLILLYENNLSYLILESLNDTFMKNTENKLFEERFRIYYHAGGVYNIFLLWFADKMRESPERMVELSIKILPKGFKSMLL